ncbi:MAG: CoB--CoM heterodisulfide reductase iron-sulfur subunit B family protein [Firmicutes bacterium]|nr:CoB--CoM heterodisulfide reductase iron-sulfur subunit B family protein [Bacillota bacterium]
MELSYYPGCSLEASAKEYNLSALTICKALGIKLTELEDWVCCGATSAHSTNQLLASTLPSQNLALAQDAGLDLAIPCAACYNRMKRADHILRHDEAKRKQIEAIVEFKYTGQIRVMSLLEAIVDGFGIDNVAKKVTTPLTGLKVACYYGCLLLRPPEITCFDSPENPVLFDRLMKSLGAEPVKWSYKTECCGASLGLTAVNTVQNMVTRILAMAEEAGGQAIVTACPLCQSNLEMRREDRRKGIPVFYFTELIGIALGLPDSKNWLVKHLIDPVPLLRSMSIAC